MPWKYAAFCRQQFCTFRKQPRIALTLSSSFCGDDPCTLGKVLTQPGPHRHGVEAYPSFFVHSCQPLRLHDVHCHCFITLFYVSLCVALLLSVCFWCEGAKHFGAKRFWFKARNSRVAIFATCTLPTKTYSRSGLRFAGNPLPLL